MFNDRGLERATQVRNRVTFGPSRGDGIHEDLSGNLHHAMGGFKRAPCLNYPEHAKHFRSRDLGHWSLSQFRKDVRFDLSAKTNTIRWYPLIFALLKPFLGDYFKGIRSLHVVLTFGFLLQL